MDAMSSLNSGDAAGNRIQVGLLRVVFTVTNVGHDAVRCVRWGR